MSSSAPVTQTVILHLKPGSVIEDKESEAGKKFIEMIDMVGKADGMSVQRWGRVVEDPNILVWCLDWESLSHNETFATGPDHVPFSTLMMEIFDLAREGGGMVMVFSTWTTPATQAFKSNITEIALLTLPEGYGEAEEKIVEETLNSVNPTAIKIGKAESASFGFISRVYPHPNLATPAGQQLAVQAVYGWESLDAHTKWFETKVFADDIKAWGPVVKKTGLGSTSLFERGIFHVKFGGVV